MALLEAFQTALTRPQQANRHWVACRRLFIEEQHVEADSYIQLSHRLRLIGAANEEAVAAAAPVELTNGVLRGVESIIPLLEAEGEEGECGEEGVDDSSDEGSEGVDTVVVGADDAANLLYCDEPPLDGSPPRPRRRVLHVSTSALEIWPLQPGGLSQLKKRNQTADSLAKKSVRVALKTL